MTRTVTLTDRHTAKRPWPRGWWIPLLLLVAAFGLTVSAVRAKSPTYDEEVQLIKGYVLWTLGDLRFGEEHPLLPSWLMGLPLLLMPDLGLPLDSPSWAEANLFEFSDQILWKQGNDATQIVFLSRLAISLLSMVLGAFVCRWATDLYGVRAGRLALGLYALAPNVLAHAGLATTDLTMACFYFVASYAFWRFVQRRSGRSLLGAGLALGLALSSKLNALLLLPISVLVAGAFALAGRRGAPRRRAAWLLAELPAIWAIALAVLWGTYLFQVAPLADGGPPVPAARYVKTLQVLQNHMQEGHEAFLMGQHSETGWWVYFPVALAIKTPLPTLILVALAAALTARDLLWGVGSRWREARRRRKMGMLGGAGMLGGIATLRGVGKSLRRRNAQPQKGLGMLRRIDLHRQDAQPQKGLGNLRRVGVRRGAALPHGAAGLARHQGSEDARVGWVQAHDLALWLPPAALFGASMAGTLNIGYRHILPVLPFMFVLGGRVASWLCTLPGGPARRAPWQRWGWVAVAALGVWYAAGSLAIYPHYLAYFNELIGGPKEGYRYLVDSNLDWGQDLPGLKRYVDEHAIPEVKLAWFGTADPAYYGLSYDLLPSRSVPMRDEAKGLYETYYPANPAPGVYAISATHLQGVYLKDDPYAWFRQREPVDRIGYSVFIYRVEPEGDGPVTLGLAGVPLAAISSADYAALGSNDVQVRWVRPQGWIWAPGSQAVWLSGKADEMPGFSLPAFQPQASVGEMQLWRPVAGAAGPCGGTAIPGKWPAATIPGDPPRTVPFPVDLGGVVAFLGYEPPGAVEAGDTARWLTCWRVLSPSARPLKLFIHLVNGRGEVVAQQDILTVPARTWRPGDLLAHTFELQVPGTSEVPGTYAVSIGWYEEEGWQRLAVRDGGQVAADHLLLSPLDVRGAR